MDASIGEQLADVDVSAAEREVAVLDIGRQLFVTGVLDADDGILAFVITALLFGAWQQAGGGPGPYELDGFLDVEACTRIAEDLRREVE